MCISPPWFADQSGGDPSGDDGLLGGAISCRSGYDMLFHVHREGNKDWANDLIRALRQEMGDSLWAVVLFGSTARDEAVEGSDLDLLLVVEELPEKFWDRTRFLRRLLPASLKGKVSFIAKTKREFEAGFPSYYLDIALDGILLFDQNGYMADKLARIRELIAEAGLHRSKISDGFIWEWEVPPSGSWRIDWSGVHGLGKRR